jgi:hypothetical protein
VTKGQLIHSVEEEEGVACPHRERESECAAPGWRRKRSERTEEGKGLRLGDGEGGTGRGHAAGLREGEERRMVARVRRARGR